MIIDRMHNAKMYFSIPQLREAFEFLKQNDLNTFENGKYVISEENDISINIQEYETKKEEDARWEAHKKYVDIQFLLYGKEKVGYMPICKMHSKSSYDEGKDIYFSDGEGDFLTLENDIFIVLFPEDAHKPGIINIKSERVRKVVVKINFDKIKKTTLLES